MRKRSAFAITGLLATLLCGCQGTRKVETGANLLLITLDTLRADHLSSYSPARAKTPHLDALAARGVRFAHATAQAPLTLPSHASIMTGLYPTTHKVRGMEGFVLDSTHRTIALAAQSSGFATGAVVGSRVLARQFGLANGFDSYDDAIGAQAEDAERRANEVTDRAIQWLQSNREKRFFLWAHYFDPHAPYDAPEPGSGSRYASEVAYMDKHVGRLLKALDEMGLAPRTLVAAIGDHGESLGEHGEATHGVFLYDSTLHVPFVLAGPRVPSGKVVEDQVRSIDVMPTLLSFLNIDPGPAVEGISLWPFIEKGARPSDAYSYGETLYPRVYLGWSELMSMRTLKWKLIAAPRPELYNLEQDPGETRNLIHESAPDAARLRTRLTEIMKRGGDRVVAKPVDTQALRVLESLGYVGAGPRQIQLGTKAPDPKDKIEVLKILNAVEDLLASRDYASAAQWMEKALRLDPANPRSHVYLASAFEHLGQYQRAVEVFQHAQQMKVDNDRIYSRMGVDYLHLNQVEKAIEAMDRASRSNPGDLNNLRNLGMAYLQTGRIDAAEKAFRAVLAQDDHYAAAHNGLGVIAVQRKDMPGAQREFERAIEVNPSEVKSVLDLGILHKEMGNRDQATRYFQRFIEKARGGPFAAQIPDVEQAIQELNSGR